LNGGEKKRKNSEKEKREKVEDNLKNK